MLPDTIGEGTRVDQIEFGGPGSGLRWRVAIGACLAALIVIGLVIWQRQPPPRPQKSSPIAHSSAAPSLCVCGGTANWVSGRTFGQGFRVNNYGNVPATVSHFAVDLPASFHQTAVGLQVTSDGNDIGESGTTLLEAYTMSPQSTAYLVVLGTVTCPATGLDPDPRVSLTVGDTRLSFEASSEANDTWQADIAKFACG